MRKITEGWIGRGRVYTFPDGDITNEALFAPKQYYYIPSVEGENDNHCFWCGERINEKNRTKAIYYKDYCNNCVGNK